MGNRPAGVVRRAAAGQEVRRPVRVQVNQHGAVDMPPLQRANPTAFSRSVGLVRAAHAARLRCVAGYS